MMSGNSNIVYEAMLFAATAHEGQVRKYTGNPYFEHLAGVAGMVSAVYAGHSVHDTACAVAWLHDCVEDTSVSFRMLEQHFNSAVAQGVWYLSNINQTGPREKRKAEVCERLADAPFWVQSIRVADGVSNLGSIVHHDPEFAKIYVPEKDKLFSVLTQADPLLLHMARTLVNSAYKVL